MMFFAFLFGHMEKEDIKERDLFRNLHKVDYIFVPLTFKTNECKT
jgi:hypothetical protein